MKDCKIGKREWGMKMPERRGRKGGGEGKRKGREREKGRCGKGGISKVKKSVPATNYTLLSIHPSISTLA